MKKTIAWICVLTVLLVGGGFLYIYSGVFNVAATKQHSAPVYWMLAKTSSRSIAVRADDIEVPPDLMAPALVQEGLMHYRAHCQQCHGARSVPPEQYAMGMTPVPPNLMPAAREHAPEELFWAVKYGIKMSGMPAWTYRMDDGEMWAVVAFVKRMASLSPAAYAGMVQAAPAAEA